MAYYTASITPTTWSTSSLDPSTELLTFVGYHLAQWASVAGAGVTCLADHTDYTGNNNLAGSRYFVVQLDSPDRLGGSDTHPDAMGFYFNIYNFYRIGWWEGHTPGTANYGAGGLAYTDELLYTTGVNWGSTTTYANGLVASIFYCDVPGERYFAWSLGGFTSYYQTLAGALIEVVKDSTVPAEQNLGWALVGYGLGTNVLTRASSDDELGLYNNSGSIYNHHSSFSGTNHFFLNEPIYSFSRNRLTHLPVNTIIKSAQPGPRLGSVIYDGKRYTTPEGGYFWLRTG